MRSYLLTISGLMLCMAGPVLADTILPGTEIRVRTDQPVDVSRWDRGRIYPAHVVRDVHAQDGDLAIPNGSYAELIVRQVGPGQYVLDLESITVNDRRYAMDTSGPHFNMPQRDYDSGGGVVGAIIGAIANASGAQAQTQGGEIRVPAGSMITFRVREPMRVVNWRDPGYQNGEYHYHRDSDHGWYR